ncbi:(3S)-malyl-CoA thioesterase [Rhodovulum adriaticum]|uniref:(3S)-malyl-CoA thioesterase n=2 Tax=Rhodovulum adriaticum TaxID=35804 RepID=A0A4R2NIK8_RHOAD|nr:(3S)-malyl-CoA thioesterase [Rhodovulum adriaticum]
MPDLTPEYGEPVIRTIAMPADTNPAGDIFGGWLMSQMDLAAGNVAARVSRGRAATIAVDEMEFHKPVQVGDEVTLYARLLKVGRSSMRIEVRAWHRPRCQEWTEQVTRGVFTFVAIDADGKARPVPRDSDAVQALDAAAQG